MKLSPGWRSREGSIGFSSFSIRRAIFAEVLGVKEGGQESLILLNGRDTSEVAGYSTFLTLFREVRRFWICSFAWSNVKLRVKVFETG